MQIPYEKKENNIKLNNNVMQEANKNKVPKPTLVDFNLQDSCLYSFDNYLNQFNNIDDLTDAELSELCKRTFIPVLDSSINIKSSDPGALEPGSAYLALMKLFSNARYITTLTNVISHNPLTFARKIYLNRIIYKYYMLPVEKKDQVVQRLLLDLSITANNDILPSLQASGLPRDIACLIAIARYSSMDEYVNISRVNAIILSTNDKELMTLQRVVDIYQYTFNTCMTKLFEGIMFEGCTMQLTNDQKEIYSIIGVAVLEMINQMPTQSIAIILRSYAGDYYQRCNQNNTFYRFSLKSLSDDYSRINEVVEYLATNEGIYLP